MTIDISVPDTIYKVHLEVKNKIYRKGLTDLVELANAAACGALQEGIWSPALVTQKIIKILAEVGQVK